MRNTNYKTPEAERQAMRIYDEALGRWPVPYETRTVATHLGETFVISWGAEGAPALVVLHGSAGNSTSWGLDAEAFGREFRVHAVDLPGETGKSTPKRPPYEGDAYPGWLADVFDGLGLEGASVAGLSLGGWAAMRFAAAHPERVSRLVLLAPGGLAPARKSFLAKAVLYRPFGMWGIRRLTGVVFSPEVPPEGAADAFAFGLRNYRARRDNLPVVSDEELRALSMPVLFLGGSGDALLDTGAGAERLRRLVPGAEVEVLEGRGHALVGVGERCVVFLRGGGSER